MTEALGKSHPSAICFLLIHTQSSTTMKNLSPGTPPRAHTLGSADIAPLTDREFESFRKLVHEWTGITLTDNKRELLYSRLTKRLRHYRFRKFQEYFDFVVDPQNKSEKQELINCITTNKTDFFREMHHFEYLRSTVFPQMVERSKTTGQKKFRLWCSASSTGEEPYSLAITISDWVRSNPPWTVDLVASDIDTVCLATARQGIYDEARIAPLTDEQKQRYVLKGKGENLGKVAMKPILRDMIDFRQINLVRDPLKFDEPFDVIFCRNVMIYFNRDVQRVLVDQFANALRPEGYLFIGHSETLHEVSDRFTPCGKTIYRLISKGAPSTPIAVPTISERPRTVSAVRTPTPPPAPAPAPSSAPSPSRVVEENLPNHSIIVGELYASREPACVATVLGSCVAACLYDPERKIGGMNHFLLPEGESEHSAPSCYGIHAMELLINEILKLGGDRRKLQAKIFGGAQIHVMSNAKLNIGKRNVEFVREFLLAEGIKIVAERVGGRNGMKVCFHTHTGRAFARDVGGTGLKSVLMSEQRQGRQITEKLAPSIQEQLTFF